MNLELTRSCPSCSSIVTNLVPYRPGQKAVELAAEIRALLNVRCIECRERAHIEGSSK